MYGFFPAILPVSDGCTMLEFDKKHKNESISEFVLRIMKHNILNLNLKPGDCINENSIAKELGVSRTPVRETFIKLSQDGLLEIYPQKGTYISLIDLDLVEESKFLRKILEKAVIETSFHFFSDEYLLELEKNYHMQEFYFRNKDYLKFFESDNQFHKLIFSACKKERIYSYMESMNFHLTRLRVLRLSANVFIDLILSQHKEILDAIKERDVGKIVVLMERHTTGNNIDVEMIRNKYPEFFKKFGSDDKIKSNLITN
jgi:GntR family transcriptional regulator, rspAB operon transcriptional repressor